MSDTIAPNLTKAALNRSTNMFMRGVTAAIRARGGANLLTKQASKAASLRDQATTRIIGIHVLADSITKRISSAS